MKDTFELLLWIVVCGSVLYGVYRFGLWVLANTG